MKPAVPQRIRRILVANRGEIAIRVMRAASELGLRTVAVYSQEDRFSLHRTKADEAYLVGRDRGPVEAYLDIEDILRIAREAQVDAIHPGYGFLAENPEFAQRSAAAGIVFVGPAPDTMRTLGNKVAARNLATAAGVAVMPATPPLPASLEESVKLAHGVGYPVMLKASWGGGGRGMRIVDSDAQLAELLPLARREAKAAFGNDEVYLEKLVTRARHVEVQILGDSHGELVHLFERDCTVQRRNQKVVERAPAVFLGNEQRAELCAAALAIGRAAHYVNAGTVEFLQDADTGKFYFIEVNPRIQVEHTVTECATGIDLVKAQIRIADGARLGTPESGVPAQPDIRLSAHALQCRITTDDPENNFIPDYGKITAYRSPAGFGIRLDAGTAYTGAIITRSYDSLLVKVTAWSPTAEETIARMHRALLEFRIRGVVTNLRFLDQVITHPRFAHGEYTTRFIDETPELLRSPRKGDRATRILTYIGAIVALPALRLRGIYLALSTAAFAVLVDRWFYTLPRFTMFGHRFDLFQSGSLTVNKPRFFGLSLENPKTYFVFGAIAFSLVALLVVAVRRSTFGQRLLALKDSPAAYATLGLNPRLTTLAVFSLSAAMAAVGGAEIFCACA